MSAQRIGFAFLLVTCAGFSTFIGAAMVFVDKFHKANKKVLAASLALSGGVMMYVP